VGLDDSSTQSEKRWFTKLSAVLLGYILLDKSWYHEYPLCEACKQVANVCEGAQSFLRELKDYHEKVIGPSEVTNLEQEVKDLRLSNENQIIALQEEPLNDQDPIESVTAQAIQTSEPVPPEQENTIDPDEDEVLQM